MEGSGWEIQNFQCNCSAWIRRRWIILCVPLYWRLSEKGRLPLNHVWGSMFMDSCNVIVASVAVCNWLLWWGDRQTETSLLFLAAAAYIELSSGFVVSLLDPRTLYQLQMWHEWGAEGVVLGVTKDANFEVGLIWLTKEWRKVLTSGYRFLRRLWTIACRQLIETEVSAAGTRH
jgi:hypothetical protein